MNFEEFLDLYVKCSDGKYRKVHDVTEQINESFPISNIIDKSQRGVFEPMEFTASCEIDEDRIRMANAKDVTPEEETWKQ